MTVSLQQALENLNNRYSEVTNLIENIYYFSDRGDSNEPGEIDDGGEDLFDDGNLISTDLDKDPLPYTHTRDAGTNDDETIPYLNPPIDGIITNSPENSGSDTYFTNMYPGLFAFGATNPSYIKINGDMGSDDEELIGSLDENQEYDENNILFGTGYKVNYKNKEYTIFTKTSDDNSESDPTLHHIIIAPGSNENWNHLIGENEEEDYEEYVNFSSAKPSIAFFFLFTTYDYENDVSVDPVTNLEEIALKLIDILFEEKSIRKLNPEYTFRVIAYSPIDIINNSLKDSYEKLEKALKKQEIYIETMDRKFRHGDTFTVAGLQAVYLKDTYVNVNQNSGRKLLEIIE
jgi:hypothetical protein